MARLKTFVNGGSLLPGDLNNIEDDYEVAFGTYKHLRTAGAQLSAATNGTYLAAGTDPSALVPATGGSVGVLWLDPARYWSIASTSGVNPRTVYYNLGASAVTNAVSVGTVTFTTGLYSVTGAAAGTPPGVTLNASAVAGSTVAIANPGTTALVNLAWSGDFAAPAAGFYGIAVVVSATMAASSSILIRTILTMRTV